MSLRKVRNNRHCCDLVFTEIHHNLNGRNRKKHLRDWATHEMVIPKSLRAIKSIINGIEKKQSSFYHF